ncbi:sodium:proton antiporter [Rhodobacteraceae bacterium NNCM2]|nr:sodium:proton antiporter [Coraliihabitans acroporae]
MDNLTLTFALIGVLGVGSQWLAVRLKMPAIVFMLVAGILAGPVFGLIDPEAEFGALFGPIIGIAVAVILFEGGVTLNFHELRDATLPVRRLCTWGAVLSWVLNTAAGYYIAGLSFTSSAIFGGILVVTGPTVIIPLLRQAKLSSRASSTLRWEAIINDPVGALFAVLAFEVAVAAQSDHLAEVGGHLVLGVVVATVVGYLAGRGLGRGFRYGLVPEYMKAPVLFAAVLAVYASTDFLLHESGLLAVTVMGIVMANMRLPSLGELKRFKEQVTVLLVSGVFVLLAASHDFGSLAALDWRAGAFIAAIILLARPIAVMLSLIGTALPMSERILVAWVAPRGVVAVAVAGFFGARLVDMGVADGAMLAPLAFLLVAVTVLLHGFTLGWVARLLGLTSTEPPGVLILGGNRFTNSLARVLRDTEVPVLMVDRNWHRLGQARSDGIPTYYGELLSEAAEHSVELSRYGTLIAATSNDDYNALVCTDLGPELGRDRIFQVGRHESSEGERDMPATIGGRTLLASGSDLDLLELRLGRGWHFTTTTLEGENAFDTYLAGRHEKAETVGLIRAGDIKFADQARDLVGREGDTIIDFAPAAEASAKPGEVGMTP